MIKLFFTASLLIRAWSQGGIFFVTLVGITTARFSKQLRSPQIRFSQKLINMTYTVEQERNTPWRGVYFYLKRWVNNDIFVKIMKFLMSTSVENNVFEGDNGEQKGIGNEECWTYSYGHPAVNAIFYYDHDSCSSAHELNRLQQDTVLNKISVSPELFNIRMNWKDVKEALGEPDEEYWRESYGGYYLIYDLSPYQLEFIADENTPDKEIYRIDLRSLDCEEGKRYLQQQCWADSVFKSSQFRCVNYYIKFEDMFTLIMEKI